MSPWWGIWELRWARGHRNLAPTHLVIPAGGLRSGVLSCRRKGVRELWMGLRVPREQRGGWRLRAGPGEKPSPPQPIPALLSPAPVWTPRTGDVGATYSHIGPTSVLQA